MAERTNTRSGYDKKPGASPHSIRRADAVCWLRFCKFFLAADQPNVQPSAAMPGTAMLRGVREGCKLAENKTSTRTHPKAGDGEVQGRSRGVADFRTTTGNVVIHRRGTSARWNWLSRNKRSDGPHNLKPPTLRRFQCRGPRPCVQTGRGKRTTEANPRNGLRSPIRTWRRGPWVLSMAGDARSCWNRSYDRLAIGRLRVKREAMSRGRAGSERSAGTSNSTCITVANR